MKVSLSDILRVKKIEVRGPGTPIPGLFFYITVEGFIDIEESGGTHLVLALFGCAQARLHVWVHEWSHAKDKTTTTLVVTPTGPVVILEWMEDDGDEDAPGGRADREGGVRDRRGDDVADDGRRRGDVRELQEDRRAGGNAVGSVHTATPKARRGRGESEEGYGAAPEDAGGDGV